MMHPAHVLVYEGEKLRDEAIERVEAANAQWCRTALAAIQLIAITNAEFTSDDVWHALEMRGIAEPTENRAMGAAFKEAMERGVCEPTERTIKSKRKQCHARPIRVWRSIQTQLTQGPCVGE